jgi:hypothetical protein
VAAEPLQQAGDVNDGLLLVLLALFALCVVTLSDFAMIT